MPAKAEEQDSATAGWASGEPASSCSPPASRALVPLLAGDAVVRHRAGRLPNAPFVAHLIAVERRVPQLRTRRRVDPADAVAVYTATLTAPPPGPGHKLRRSV